MKTIKHKLGSSDLQVTSVDWSTGHHFKATTCSTLTKSSLIYTMYV